MYTPYPENMMESVKKVEATRKERMSSEPRRLTADEKDALLKEFHPDYNPNAFAEIKVGPNKGEKAPLELAKLLHSTSRILTEDIDLTKIDYDVDVLVIGGGGAGASCAIEAHNAGANVMMVTKLRIGDANTMMAEGGIQAADKENDSPVQHYLDAFGGGHFAARPELVKRLVMEAPDAIKWLNDLGVMFDKDEEGRMLTTHGGGSKNSGYCDRWSRTYALSGIPDIQSLRSNGRRTYYRLPCRRPASLSGFHSVSSDRSCVSVTNPRSTCNRESSFCWCAACKCRRRSLY